MQRHSFREGLLNRIGPGPALSALLLCVFIGTAAAQTQEAYLVDGFFSGLGVYDLATSNPLASISASANNFAVAVGPNPRLAFISTGNYLSIVDLTIQREIRRMPQVPYSRFSAFSSDGRFLLLFDSTRQTLDVIDASSFRVFRKVNLLPIFRTSGGFKDGSIVVVGSNAYVTLKQPIQSRPVVAMVDLHTFKVRAIPIAAGATSGGRTLPNAAATPDGKYLVMMQGSKLNFLNLTTKTIQLTRTLSGSPFAIAITPNGADPTNVYGYVIRRISGNTVASVVDLRPNSQTFGQLVAGTDVSLNIGSNTIGLAGVSINAAGTRLVIAGEHLNPNGPLPNALVLDTGLMLTNPSAAIVGKSTVSNGGSVEATTVASITTVAPASAPVVTAVSANVTNDANTTIHVFGSNFAPGALVRIGSMPPLPATFLSSSDMVVTVPQNAPAGPNQDVIVTNPNLAASPALRNQSGLLAGGITVTATSAFQPQYQMGVSLLGGGVQVLDLQQRAMVNLAPSDPILYGITFNRDGSEFYGFSAGPDFWPEVSEAIGWKLANQSLQATIALPNANNVSNQGLVASINPATLRPVVYAPANISSGQNSDLQLLMVDTDPLSQTYNSVVQTLNAGINAQFDNFNVLSFGATPDGRYVYVNYLDGNTSVGMLAIFDIINGGPATLMTMSSLGADDNQNSLLVAPDGRTLLLSEAYANYYGEEIKVFDIATNPKSPALIGTIAGSITNKPYASLYSFQVAGGHLFATESYTSSVIAFNFDPSHSNFGQLGSYAALYGTYFGALAVSPDGALIYLPDSANDIITVLDGVKLANGQSALVTNLASGSYPYLVAMSPLINGPAVADRQRPGNAVMCCTAGGQTQVREPSKNAAVLQY